MNGLKYLIDTCTLIGLQKQTHDSLSLLGNKQALINECAISVITYMEFVGFYGVDTKTAEQLQQIANVFVCLPIRDDVVNQTIAIRQRHKIKLPDGLILATAKVHDLQLLTLDEKLKRIDKEIG